MAHPAIIVILVAAADVQNPSTTALTRAAREALGPDAVVVVQEVETNPKPSDAAAVGKKLHADAVASVTWMLPDRRRAHVRVVITSDGHVVDRDLDFTSADADAERGRAVGLAIVATVPEPRDAPTAPAPTPPRPETPAEPTPRFGLDMFALAASGPFGIGGGVAGRFLPFPSPRLGASLATSTIAEATIRTFGVTVGIAPRLHESIGARVELGMTLHGEERSRVLGNVRVLGEGAWWTSRSFGLGIAAGVEVAFGETRLMVGDTAFGSIPRARFVLELALRGRT